MTLTTLKKGQFDKIIKGKKWYYLNSDISEKNFPLPATNQTENWKVIKMNKSFSSQEALDRIKIEGCRPATIHELTVFQGNHPEAFPDEIWTGMLAFGTDYTDSDGDHRVPGVYRGSDGVWRFNLGGFEGDWFADHCLLCFCDTQSSDPSTISPDVVPLTLTRAIEIVKKEGYVIYKPI